VTIHIENLKFNCIIGILDFERVEEQTVILNLSIDYNYISEYINYAIVVEFLKSKMITTKFFLIEDALLKLSNSLKQEFNNIEKTVLKITKPSILPNCEVSVSHTIEY